MMNSFSLRRMMLFCRLQIGEMYGKNLRRTFLGMLASIFVVLVFALIFESVNLEESLGFAERMLFVLSFVASVAFYADLVAYRMMIPVSTAEKYVAIYVEALLTMAVYLVLSVPVGSVFFTFVALVRESSVQPPVILFIREGFELSGVLGGLFMLPMMIWIRLFIGRRRSVREKNPSRAKRKFYSATVWSVLAGMVLLLMLPVILREAGLIDKESASMLFAAVAVFLAVVYVAWSYRLFRKVELDSDGND